VGVEPAAAQHALVRAPPGDRSHHLGLSLVRCIQLAALGAALLLLPLGLLLGGGRVVGCAAAGGAAAAGAGASLAAPA
jgi:hypothetical protein